MKFRKSHAFPSELIHFLLELLNTASKPVNMEDSDNDTTLPQVRFKLTRFQHR